MTRNYLEIETLRFADRLTVRCEIEPDARGCPPNCLDPLVRIGHNAEPVSRGQSPVRCRSPTGMAIGMQLLIIAGALTIVILVVLLRHQRAELRWAERRARELEDHAWSAAENASRLESEKLLLSGFLGVLPALVHELRCAATDRQIMRTLLDTLVSTIEPRRAAVLMRRRKSAASAGTGVQFAVTATTPEDSPAKLGLEITLAADARDPSSFDGKALRRAGLPFNDPLLSAPLIIETEVLGLIALTPSAPGPEMPLVVQAVADVGALALHEAAIRQRIRTASEIDDLTQLYNRRYIIHSLADHLRLAEAGKRPMSVLLFDIDHFKRYNDLNGHLAGDILLRLLAQLVQNNLRATDVVGRYGGEEFLVILPNTVLVEAYLVADKLRSLIAAHDFPACCRQPLGLMSVSGGVAEFPAHATSATHLLRAADDALYAAKREGRNRIVLASGVTRAEQAETALLEEEWDEEKR